MNSNPSVDLTVERTDLGDLDVAWLTDPRADPAAPLALLLHGFPDSAQTWRYLIPALTDAGFRPVAPWLRGYAPTSVPVDGLYQVGALARDASGHDWGAMATYAAVGWEPDRWNRAVAMAVPPAGAMFTGFTSYDQLRRSWYMFFFQSPLADGVVASDDLAFIDRLWADWSPGHDPSGDLDAPQAGWMTAPSVPVLYLHGADDGCVGADVAASAGDHLPISGSRAETLDGVGHFLHVEAPERVNPLITAFLTADLHSTAELTAT